MNGDPQGLSWEMARKFMKINSQLMLLFKRNKHKFSRFDNQFQGQGRVLALLQKHPVISQRELTRYLDMRPQSASELISKLEREGYLRRYKSVEDRRVMIVELTNLGREALNEGGLSEDRPILGSSLSEAEKLEFNRLLDKLGAELEAELGEQRTPFSRRR